MKEITTEQRLRNEDELHAKNIRLELHYPEAFTEILAEYEAYKDRVKHMYKAPMQGIFA